MTHSRPGLFYHLAVAAVLASSATCGNQQAENRSVVPPRLVESQPPHRVVSIVPTDTVSSTLSSHEYNNDGATDERSISRTRILRDLVRLEFSGSVETHIFGPPIYTEDGHREGDAIRPPLFEVGDTNANMRWFPNRFIPSLHIGAEYDFGQKEQPQQRRWHGISNVWTRLNFRPTSKLTVDVTRDQSITPELPSSTAVQCSWPGGLRSTYQTTSSHCRSILVCMPILPARLQWECCCFFSDNEDLLKSFSKPTDRSGWLVDAMGQIQGSQSIRLSDQLYARCSLRRRIRWISSDEGLAESTHVGISLQYRHGNHQSSTTMATFAAQIDQLQETAQLKIRHDIAIGNLLHP